MYEEFFHLSKAPFSMTPDPEFFFLAPTHREALSGLLFTVLYMVGSFQVSSVVGKVLPNRPAAQVGLHVGDRILAISGKPVRATQISSTIRGFCFTEWKKTAR